LARLNHEDSKNTAKKLDYLKWKINNIGYKVQENTMIVKTMRGKTLDMGRLIAQNDTAIALGNANMNARGDIIDRKGQVVRKREDTAHEYFKGNPNSVKQVALRDISSEVFVTPAQAAANLQAQQNVTSVVLSPPKKRKIEDREL
jgi:hypothetical protein